MPFKETKLILMEDLSHSQYAIYNHKVSLVRPYYPKTEDKIKA